MRIDWLWRPYPELRDLPPAERKRIWRRCCGRALLSWQFAVTVLLSSLVMAAISLDGVLALFALRLAGMDATWVSLLNVIIVWPILVVGMMLTMQPWVNETRRRIRAEREATKTPSSNSVGS